MAFSFSLMGSPGLYADVSTQTHSHQNTMGLASEASPPRVNHADLHGPRDHLLTHPLNDKCSLDSHTAPPSWDILPCSCGPRQVYTLITTVSQYRTPFLGHSAMLLWAQAGIYTGHNSVSPFPLVMKTQRPQTRAQTTPMPLTYTCCSAWSILEFLKLSCA